MQSVRRIFTGNSRRSLPGNTKKPGSLGLVLQVLPDLLEKQLDLPAFFVDSGRLPGLEMAGIGDGPVIDAGCRAGCR